ncbi:hypothetical protein OPV22_024838 [Ensete ventricosum]|uniref:Uncharacterized protein n=1 Tax=Ensete ventricosum TaxID=4639 RepID=A0AAV8QG05_ENSVE|nr:hypothetical protein OPV22_024838 [Ensete ventricosum]
MLLRYRNAGGRAGKRARKRNGTVSHHTSRGPSTGVRLKLSNRGRVSILGRFASSESSSSYPPSLFLLYKLTDLLTHEDTSMTSETPSHSALLLRRKATPPQRRFLSLPLARPRGVVAGPNRRPNR